MSDTPGRNDPCPCGSGNKYKHCCRGRTPWYKNKTVVGLALGAFLVVGLLLFGSLVSGQFGSSQPDCPPGQVWSEAHGHCH